MNCENDNGAHLVLRYFRDVWRNEGGVVDV
jgi:hypothetical protein